MLRIHQESVNLNRELGLIFWTKAILRIAHNQPRDFFGNMILDNIGDSANPDHTRILILVSHSRPPTTCSNNQQKNEIEWLQVAACGYLFQA